MRLFTLFLSLFWSISSQAIEITTENGSENELETVRLLKALRTTHPIQKWEITDKVHIDQATIPHSHPVLTLHTRHNGPNDIDQLLSTYIHEQLHWQLDRNNQATHDAVAELKELFLDVPVGHPEGGRDEFSTYIHLLVCYLELDAIAQLLSEERYNRVVDFWTNDHYTWIYKQVVDRNQEIGTIVEKYGLNKF